MESHTCSPENAPKFWQWINERGGLAVWGSVNFSNLGQTWTTPLLDNQDNPTQKPTWQAGDEPTRIIKDSKEVVVVIPKEVKRFHVAVRVRSNGMAIYLTDTSSERLRKAVAEAGPGAWYEFDYFCHQNAVIFVADKQIPLDEWYRELRLSAGYKV